MARAIIKAALHNLTGLGQAWQVQDKKAARQVHVIEEPLAALLAQGSDVWKDAHCVVPYDMGGSSDDLLICHPTANAFKMLWYDSRALDTGGLVVDRMIEKHMCALRTAVPKGALCQCKLYMSAWHALRFLWRRMRRKDTKQPSSQELKTMLPTLDSLKKMSKTLRSTVGKYFVGDEIPTSLLLQIAEYSLKQLELLVNNLHRCDKKPLIFMTGGGCQLAQLREDALEVLHGLKVTWDGSPSECVAAGAAVYPYKVRV